MPEAHAVGDQERREIARRMRTNIVKSTTAAGSGHPSTSLSQVELLTVLYFAMATATHDDDEHDEEHVQNDRRSEQNEPATASAS